jgi:hypothetical protein
VEILFVPKGKKIGMESPTRRGTPKKGKKEFVV